MTQSYPRDMEPEDIAKHVSYPFPTILEIGCNDGTDTNKMLEVFPKAFIFCFEPDPRGIARFKQTVHSDRVRLLEVAVSDQDGEAIFYGSAGQPPKRNCSPENHYCQLPEWDLSGSLCKPTGHLDYSPWVTFPQERQVQVKTMKLDTWWKTGRIAIDFIWADVQGAEAMLILGATEALKHTQYFYTEYYDSPMYEGQPNLATIQAMLPNFKLIAKYGRTNALFENLLTVRSDQ